MDLQERYDELDNIVSTLNSLIDEINDESYIEDLQYIKYQAENERDKVEADLQKEQDKEEKEMNRQYIESRL